MTTATSAPVTTIGAGLKAFGELLAQMAEAEASSLAPAVLAWLQSKLAKV